jgi:hypothetical protein
MASGRGLTGGASDGGVCGAAGPIRRRITAGALFRPPVTPVLEVGLRQVPGLRPDRSGCRRSRPNRQRVASAPYLMGVPNAMRLAAPDL